MRKRKIELTAEKIDQVMKFLGVEEPRLDMTEEEFNVWGAKLKEEARIAWGKAQTLPYLVVRVITIAAAAKLAYTKRTVRYSTELLFQEWITEDKDTLCVLKDDGQGFVFVVESTDPAYDGVLVRFALVDAETREERVTGLLIPHPDHPHQLSHHYIGSVRLGDDPGLPERCQPHLTIVDLSPEKPVEIATLLTAALMAAHEEDRQSWRGWITKRHDSGRLTKGEAEAILQKLAAR